MARAPLVCSEKNVASVAACNILIVDQLLNRLDYEFLSFANSGAGSPGALHYLPQVGGNETPAAEYEITSTQPR